MLELVLELLYLLVKSKCLEMGLSTDLVLPRNILKRLKATPLTPFEYLSAQMLSRLFLLAFTLTILWIGCDLVFHFNVEGSYLDLAVIFLAGCLSLTAMGLVVASRGVSLIRRPTILLKRIS